MKRPGLIRGLLVILSLYAAGYKGHTLNTYRCAHTNPRITIDGDYISFCAYDTIQQFLGMLHTQHHVTLAECIMLTQQQFPYLKSTGTLFTPDLCAHYTFACSVPQFLINGTYVLTVDGLLINKDIFTPTAYQALPALNINPLLIQQDRHMSTLASSMNTMDRNLITTYHIQWHSIHTADLSNPDEPYFKIIFDTLSIPTTPILQQCTMIKHELAMTDIKHNHGWIADIRFNNQIVVYKNERGGYD